MKALTLHQPWASLIAVGAKTIETRSWSTSHRGPLAIHAAKRTPDLVSIGDYDCEPWFDTVRHVEDCYCERDGIAPDCARRSASRTVLTRIGLAGSIPLPLGAIVATCTLVDVVPTEAITWIPDGDIAGPGRWGVGDKCAAVEESERPYGDFTPGRYAWLLGDIEPCEPIPTKGHQGLWEWLAVARTPVRAER